MAQFLTRGVLHAIMRVRTVRGEMPLIKGPFIIACTHPSHFDPFVLSVVVRRPIDWMARIEFFRTKVSATTLRLFNAFAVNRHGYALSALRTAIRRLGEGRLVGICPEGGVARGMESAMRGGAIKRGVCLVARRAGVPVVPCIMLGTHTLINWESWLPLGRGRLYVAFGQPIWPRNHAPSRRAAREVMARELEEAYQALFAELRGKYQLADSSLP
jgi:1-acyl-sn-glycerol-3-phosphate acyltransferase